MYGPLVGMNNLQPTEGNEKTGPVQSCHMSVAFLLEVMRVETFVWEVEEDGSHQLCLDMSVYTERASLLLLWVVMFEVFLPIVTRDRKQEIVCRF